MNYHRTATKWKYKKGDMKIGKKILFYREITYRLSYLFAFSCVCVKHIGIASTSLNEQMMWFVGRN